MASSGTYGFNMTVGETVLEAFGRIAVKAPQLTQEHMVDARRAVNLLLVEAANRQVNLWKVEELSIALVNGTAVYSIPPRVVMILDAWVTVNEGQQNETDLYVTPVSRTDYASFSSKITPGRPTCYWFNRLIAPEVSMWPVPDASGPYTFGYYACVQMQDANLAGGETPDLPYLWLDWFAAGLAHRLSRKYAPALEATRKIDAAEAWAIAATQNTENVSLSLVPTISSYYRR